jgi:hypothetical protein
VVEAVAEEAVQPSPSVSEPPSPVSVAVEALESELEAMPSDENEPPARVRAEAATDEGEECDSLLDALTRELECA